MNYEDYMTVSSEITQLKELLESIPEERVIDRLGLEQRLIDAEQKINGQTPENLRKKAKVTFKGAPVVGTHGIFADFASKASGALTDAIAAISAGLVDNLRYMGPIPDREKNNLLITGTALGSFGFEFEIPKLHEDTLFPNSSKAEKALEKISELFLLASSDGTDDELTSLVQEIHPRAVRKTADFLNILADSEAWCALEFNQKLFRFRDKQQVTDVIHKISEENISVSEESFSGEFQGVLPASRNFEFKTDDLVLKGKIGPEIEEPDDLNRSYLHKPSIIKLHVTQVGQGRPKYLFSKMEDISLLDS